MISKPTTVEARDHAAVRLARTTAVTGMAAARAGGHALRAAVCFGFAALWGFAALAAGLGGSLPTFFGVGLMSLGMAWAGRRALRKAAATVETGRQAASLARS